MMTLYEAMFTRRSVRRYDEAPLSREELDSILTYVQSVEPLPGQTADYRIIGQEQMGLNMAPHYLVANCAETNEAYANVGYVLEKLDLHLQSSGLGSLWYGMKLPKESRPGDAIVMAFGRTDVPPRKADSDFNRLKLGEITETDNALTRAARLAPSAVNSQPWKLQYLDGAVVIRYYGRGLMKGRLEKKLNKIDNGIVTRFVVTALEQEGRKLTGIETATEGRSFTITVKYE